MGGHGGRGGLFCSGLCASVSVSAFGLLPRQHSLRCCVACTGSPLAATGPGGSPASLGPSPWMVPTADAAFVRLALDFQTFPHSALTSLTHRAPRAFRRHRQDFNATAWQVSAGPSSLTSDPCGWVARPEAAPFSRLCCWGARFWLSGLEPRDRPLLLPPCSARGGLPAGASGSCGQADPAWHGLSVPLVPWHGSGPVRGLGEARGASCGRGDSPAHPEVHEAGLWHPWARCLRGGPAQTTAPRAEVSTWCWVEAFL